MRVNHAIISWGCTSSGVYVPCIYMHARWELLYMTEVFVVVLVLCISSAKTLTWHACKCKVHQLHQRYILMRMHLWWSLCTLCLHACQVRVTIGDSSLCCCTCVMYLEHQLTPMCVDSLYKCILANTSAIWQQAAHTTCHLLAAQQEPYTKA